MKVGFSFYLATGLFIAHFSIVYQISFYKSLRISTGETRPSIKLKLIFTCF